MEKDKRLAGLFTEKRAEALDIAAREFDLEFQVIAKPGMGYDLNNGGELKFDSINKVPERMVVGAYPVEAEETEGFWERVMEIQTSLEKQDTSR